MADGEVTYSKESLKHLIHMWQYDKLGTFHSLIMKAVTVADDTNRERMRQGFPLEVAAYEAYTQTDIAEEMRREGLLD
jgi:hypothetical protein